MDTLEKPSILSECINHVMEARQVLKHHQYFTVTYDGEDKISFASSKTSLKKTITGVDQYIANAFYLECIAMNIFTIHSFRCAPNTAYHLVYKRK